MKQRTFARLIADLVSLQDGKEHDVLGRLLGRALKALTDMRSDCRVLSAALEELVEANSNRSRHHARETLKEWRRKS
jgi:hypothetical protein